MNLSVLASPECLPQLLLDQPDHQFLFRLATGVLIPYDSERQLLQFAVMKKTLKYARKTGVNVDDVWSLLGEVSGNYWRQQSITDVGGHYCS